MTFIKRGYIRTVYLGRRKRKSSRFWAGVEFETHPGSIYPEYSWVYTFELKRKEVLPGNEVISRSHRLDKIFQEEWMLAAALQSWKEGGLCKED